jgi:hypothetical protein
MDLLAPVWKKRLEEYVEPELDTDRKKNPETPFTGKLSPHYLTPRRG